MRFRQRGAFSFFNYSVLGAAVILVCSQIRAQQPTQKNKPAAKEHPIIQPMRWLVEAHKNIQKIPDYKCTLIKQERINGKLHQPHMIALKFRRQPFSVNMRWLHPRTEVIELSYIQGWNNNKMRIKVRGGPLKRLAGFVSVSPDDRRVTSKSRHRVTDAGLENLIVKLFRGYEIDYKLNKTQVKVEDGYKFDNKECHRIETIHTERHTQFYCYRTVVYLDKETKLPIRCENFDWPFQGSPAGGSMIEAFSYARLQTNVGLTDSDFRR